MAKSPLRRFFRILALLFIALIVGGLTIAYFVITPILKDLPDVKTLQNVQYQIPLSIYSKEGLLIARFGEKKRTPIEYKDVPKQLIDAFIAAEDDRFYQHPGVDYRGLLRASLQLLTTGKKLQGGSTITMQVTRNFLLSPEKTYVRKLKEIILALKIEKTFTKQQILELYLNKIYLGQRSYGVIAAAETYFGKPLNELNLAELALIAGLPKAPSVYNPVTDPERAQQRRNYVLHRMFELNYITKEQLDTATATPIVTTTTVAPEQRIELEAPYIAEMARQYIVEHYGEQAAYSSGFNVYTTVPAALQTISTRALRTALYQYDQRHGYRKPSKQTNYNPDLAAYRKIGDTYPAQITAIANGSITAQAQDGTSITINWPYMKWAIRSGSSSVAAIKNVLNIGDIIRIKQTPKGEWALTQVPNVEGAFVALNPQTGAILALEGGFDFSKNKYNRATQSSRQPGSGFKPIIYTTALENGFTPSSVIVDAPIVISDPGTRGGWRPENFGRKFYGPTPLRTALKYSRNIVAIKLLKEVGIKKAADTAKRFGFESSQIPRSYSMALGSGQASPLQMARMYSVFANGGSLITPYLVERIEDHDNKIIYQHTPEEPKRIITAAVSYLMNSMLRDVVQSGTAARARVLGRNDIAGKTGTTNDQKDVWFNGYTPTIAASAWMGFDNPTSLGNDETGGETALPMWINFMRDALKGEAITPLKAPETVIKGFVNPKTGTVTAKANSRGGNWEEFDSENAPKGIRAEPAVPGDPKKLRKAGMTTLKAKEAGKAGMLSKTLPGKTPLGRTLPGKTPTSPAKAVPAKAKTSKPVARPSQRQSVENLF